VELEGRVLVLRRVHVTYRLAVDADVDRDAIERVHGFHAEHCPVYRSLHPQVSCTTSYELVDV
jgi:uncharacterized OsmC-like protein